MMIRHASPILVLAGALAAAGQDWKPVEGHLMTRWGREVSAGAAWAEYPRPQLVRPEWRNLNGLWEYAVTGREAAAPARYDGRILVPFCIESALSGVKKAVSPAERLWYRRSFTVPAEWKGRRLLLHFGAVDWEAEVWVNGIPAGRHRGGYTPFSFDITGHLKPAGEQQVVVAVWDPTDTGTQPRGKQVLDPRGIWYTAVTGIWQTVWLEPVGEVSIERLVTEPDIDRKVLRLTVLPRAEASGTEVTAVALDAGAQVARVSGRPGEPMELAIREPKLWSPESPHLYDLQVTLSRGGGTLDEVTSYFGMRKSSLGRDRHGRIRLMLNDQPYFQIGPLDQGWWPDGLYTAPSDEALRYDIEVLRRLGFNMARKHVKLEPARWYYHCDKLGLLVWQDMPSAYIAGRGPAVGPTAPDAVRDGVSSAQFEGEFREMIDAFSHFPSIAVWVPFNEGWGQYDTARIASWVKRYDPTRLVNATSGWTDRGVGDMYDTHMYPGPGMEDAGPGRATVLGEFGGLGWPVEGHLWWNRRNWGYLTIEGREEVNRKYLQVVGDVHGLLGFGLSAAVYTQTTDVEGEVNGLMTYDRAMVKFDEEPLAQLHGRLRRASPIARVILPASENQPRRWRYFRGQPAGDWGAPEFDDGNWLEGAAPFQPGNDPLFPTGTVWESGAIWMRRAFEVDKIPANLWGIVLHRLTRGAVYLNGTKIMDFAEERPTDRHYRHTDLSRFATLLKPGRNVVAVHADSDEARRAVDLGLYTLD